jgi:protein-S-isoprenylcysteine O-methyltransferase Ste14
MSENERDHAGMIAPPPLIYAGILISGLAIHFFLPISFLPNPLNLILGVPLVVLGLGIGFTAMRAMQRADTPPEPWEPTRAIVADGAFRFTRNPFYLSFALMYLGIALAVNALAALLLFPAALFMVHFGIILREEKYLERKFGDEYSQYKHRVRRWL